MTVSVSKSGQFLAIGLMVFINNNGFSDNYGFLAEEVERYHVSIKYCMTSHKLIAFHGEEYGRYAKLYSIWPKEHFISPQPSRV